MLAPGLHSAVPIPCWIAKYSQSAFGFGTDSGTDYWKVYFLYMFALMDSETEGKDYAGIDGFIFRSFLGLLAWTFLFLVFFLWLPRVSPLEKKALCCMCVWNQFRLDGHVPTKVFPAFVAEAATARPFVDLASFHEDFAASIGPTVEDFPPMMSSLTQANSVILARHMSGSPAS